MARPGFDDVVLLTGLPSLLARRVAQALLESPRRTLLHVLVSPRSERETVAYVEGLPRSQRERIVLHGGEAHGMDLGLGGREYLELAGELDGVHHCPSPTLGATERSSLERLHLGSAREMVELGRAAKLRSLVHYSTALVSGSRTGLVLESELDVEQRFRDVATEVRARAERRMRAAAAELPVCVVRPTLLVGDAETGEVDREDAPYLLFLLIVASPPDLAVPLPGDCDHPLHLVPVDYVARAAVHLSHDPRARGRTFHLVDPEPLTARQIFERIAAAAGHRPPKGGIPTPLAKMLLKAPGIDRLVKAPSYLLDALVTPVRYDTTHTRELLAGTGIECPPFGSYVHRLVAHVQGRLRERRSRRPEALAPESRQ